MGVMFEVLSVQDLGFRVVEAILQKKSDGSSGWVRTTFLAWEH